MKKNFLGSIFCLFIIIGSTISCSEDKGNYDYININEAYVDTVGQKTSFVVGQYEVLEIIPDIKFTQQDRNNTLITVLSEEKNLSAAITQAPLSTDYAVVLYITDKETGLVSQTKYIVSVQASILSGIMVLHGNSSRSLTTSRIPIE